MAKVLVVDDNPDFVEIARTVLESNGHMATTAADGDPALARIRADRLALDGFNVGPIIREGPNLKHPSIVMATFIADTSRAQLFSTDDSPPVDGWIPKPVKPAERLKTVERLT